MEEFGLTDIEYQGEDEDAPVEHAPLMRYTATYPIEDIAVEDVSIPNVDRTEFVVDGQDLDIEGVVDVWNEDGSVFAAGGVYPVESYQHTERFEITDAVDFSIDIDLQFDHARQETEVKAFIGTVGP